jgi:GNAT superfamily N-acetyltransferase
MEAYPLNKWPDACRSESRRTAEHAVDSYRGFHTTFIGTTGSGPRAHARVRSLASRHLQDAHLINAYFDADAFEEELATLPGNYSRPDGGLLLAHRDGAAAGCVAFRRLDAAACEMKRMFVYPQFHGRGIGWELGQAIVDDARRAGYSVMRLDTSLRQTEAQRLYAKLGFRGIDPYCEHPPAVRNWLVFMELTL